MHYQTPNLISQNGSDWKWFLISAWIKSHPFVVNREFSVQFMTESGVFHRKTELQRRWKTKQGTRNVLPEQRMEVSLVALFPGWPCSVLWLYGTRMLFRKWLSWPLNGASCSESPNSFTGIISLFQREILKEKKKWLMAFINDGLVIKMDFHQPSVLERVWIIRCWHKPCTCKNFSKSTQKPYQKSLNFL